MQHPNSNHPGTYNNQYPGYYVGPQQPPVVMAVSSSGQQLPIPPQMMMAPPMMVMTMTPSMQQHAVPIPIPMAHPLQHQHSPPPPGSPYVIANDTAAFNTGTPQQSQPPPKTGHELFVGDLSYFCEEHHLFDLFKGFGVVTETRIKRNDRGGRTLMYGFVTMASLPDAEHASKSLNGRLFMGRNMRVELSGPGVDTHTMNAKHTASKSGYQIHVAFISTFPSNAISHKPDEIFLRNLFEPFGKIRDIAIKEYIVHKNDNKQDGYCFVTFTAEEEAKRATEALNSSTHNGISLTCTLSYRNPVNRSDHGTSTSDSSGTTSPSASNRIHLATSNTPTGRRAPSSSAQHNVRRNFNENGNGVTQPIRSQGHNAVSNEQPSPQMYPHPMAAVPNMHHASPAYTGMEGYMHGSRPPLQSHGAMVAGYGAQPMGYLNVENNGTVAMPLPRALEQMPPNVWPVQFAIPPGHHLHGHEMYMQATHTSTMMSPVGYHPQTMHLNASSTDRNNSGYGGERNDVPPHPERSAQQQQYEYQQQIHQYAQHPSQQPQSLSQPSGSYQQQQHVSRSVMGQHQPRRY